MLLPKKQKNEEKKLKNLSRQLEWRERPKKLKKKHPIILACHDVTHVSKGLISAIWNGGNEENDKKKPQKWKWVILVINF